MPGAVELVDAGGEPLGQARLAVAPRAQRAADDERRCRPSAAAEVGQDGAARACPASRRARRARRRSPRPVPLGLADRADQPGRGAAGLLDDRWRPRGRRPARRLLAGMSPAARRRTWPGCSSTRSGSRTSSTPMTSAMRLAGDVVLGRAEAAAHDHRVAAGQGAGAARPTMRSRLSPTFVWKWESMPAERELLADPGRVGVDDLPEQQLGADGHDFTAHARVR